MEYKNFVEKLKIEIDAEKSTGTQKEASK